MDVVKDLDDASHSGLDLASVRICAALDEMDFECIIDS